MSHHHHHAHEEHEMTYEQQVEAHREAKDESFRSETWSPIPDRQSFRGLHYYDVDPQWRFRVRLQGHDEPKTLRMQTSTGDVREYQNIGKFTIHVDGQDVDVQAYLQADGDSLFVPFRDKTSGKGTYGAGRYLDLHYHGVDEEYDVDFNLAYNPFCAYNESFSCPMPPPENWLQIEVPAGEKDWK